jgi:hypothetical protein
MLLDPSFCDQSKILDMLLSLSFVRQLQSVASSMSFKTRNLCRENCDNSITNVHVLFIFAGKLDCSASHNFIE